MMRTNALIFALTLNIFHVHAAHAQGATSNPQPVPILDGQHSEKSLSSYDFIWEKKGSIDFLSVYNGPKKLQQFELNVPETALPSGPGIDRETIGGIRVNYRGPTIFKKIHFNKSGTRFMVVDSLGTFYLGSLGRMDALIYNVPMSHSYLVESDMPVTVPGSKYHVAPIGDANFAIRLGRSKLLILQPDATVLTQIEAQDGASLVYYDSLGEVMTPSLINGPEHWKTSNSAIGQATKVSNSSYNWVLRANYMSDFFLKFSVKPDGYGYIFVNQWKLDENGKISSAEMDTPILARVHVNRSNRRYPEAYFIDSYWSILFSYWPRTDE